MPFGSELDGKKLLIVGMGTIGAHQVILYSLLENRTPSWCGGLVLLNILRSIRPMHCEPCFSFVVSAWPGHDHQRAYDIYSIYAYICIVCTHVVQYIYKYKLQPGL